MKEHELEGFRQKLLKKREEQGKKIKRFDEINAIDYNNGKELSMFDNHPAEIGSETYEIGKNMALKQQQVKQLRDIDSALKDIDSGSYGICKGCGENIPIERLEVMPTSKLCVECQDESEADILTAPDKNRRPVEEESLYPPFSRTTSDDTDAMAYDGEDAWQDVARYNKIENIALDWYDNNLYDDEKIEEREKIENITNQQYEDQLPNG